MQVIYRITSIPSTNPSPIYQEDKNKLNELCLKSFIKAFSDVKPNVIFLADHVNDFSYLENFPWEHEIIETFNGQNQAMLNSYDIASKLDDYVVFQECDYIYDGVVGEKYLKAMEKLGIVSPYDHPNFYRNRDFHQEECKLSLIGDKHFRTCERNTMTWGCHSNIINNFRYIFDKYGYLDGDVWYDMKANGYDLWTPITSFATHMVIDNLAPGVEWEKIWNTL